MTRVEFERTFAAAHRVWNDPGKCSNIHGHNYRVTVSIVLEDGALTEQGFVVPFDAVKAAIDAFDHTLIVDDNDPLFTARTLPGVEINWVAGVPSTEFLADLLAKRIVTAVSAGNPDARRFTVQVKLRETDSIEAVAEVASEWLR